MGGGPSSTTSTVTQTNLPKYAEPYYKAMMNRGLSESQRPYQTYGGERLAGMSDATATGLGMSSDFANSSTGAGQNAIDLSSAAGLGGLAASGYAANGVTNAYNGPQQGAYQGSAMSADQIGWNGQPALGNFDQAAAQQYMSPYMQDVVDKSKYDASRNYMQEEAMRNADLGASGAFGGSRAAVQTQVARNSLMDRLTGIDVQGAQDAYTNAQQQFNADRSAQFGVAQSNQQANLTAAQANEQSRQYGYGATESAFQKANEFGQNAQQLSEQFRQSGTQLGLKGLDIANQSASQMTQGQQALDAMNLNRIKAQLGLGQTTEDYKQQSLDQSYNDFVNQRDSERQNLQFLSSLLQGVPISANRDITQTGTPTNPLAGALGTASGLQALYGLGNTQG